MATLTAAIEGLGLWGIVIGMFLESAYVPLPSEVILPYAGFLVASGRIGFVAAALAALVGSMAGALLSYLIARAGGRFVVLHWGRYVGVRAKELDRAERWFRHYGDGAVFFGRLLPGIRTYISLPAGVAEMPWGRFMAFSFLGALPWTVLFIWAGWALGQHWQQVGPYARDFAVVAGVLTAVWLARMLWRGRRG